MASFSTTFLVNSTDLDIDFCVGPLVKSSNRNPISDYGEEFSNCALSCDAGQQIYGLTDSQENAIDTVGLIGTILCLIGLIILSFNLYSDQKHSTEKFRHKPVLAHIPYVITCSCFMLTFMLSISFIVNKQNVVCLDNEEISVWNPMYGHNINCTVFSVFYYSSMLYYFFYTLLLSFIVWRQFKNPMRPLWDIRDRYWHLMVFGVVLFLNVVSLITSSIDAIEPMGVCLPGPASKIQLFLFITFPMSFCYVLSAIFLISSAVMVRRTIVKNKRTVTRNATMSMVDLYKRLLVYAFGVLFALSLLVITGFAFWLKHDVTRNGLKTWIICELQNYYGMNQDCEALRKDEHKISPFYFMSWTIACFIAICAQIILSFHGKARQRASTYIRQKTQKFGAVVRVSKLDVLSNVESPVSPQTTDLDTVSSGNPSSVDEDGNIAMITLATKKNGDGLYKGVGAASLSMEQESNNANAANTEV